MKAPHIASCGVAPSVFWLLLAYKYSEVSYVHQTSVLADFS